MGDRPRGRRAADAAAGGLARRAQGEAGGLAVWPPLDPDRIDRHRFLSGVAARRARGYRGISADPIAEYVLAAILGFEKRIHDIRPRSRAEWKITPLGSLSGKTIGIAGFGAIGRAVAERAKPFGVNIRVLRRSAWPYVLPGIRPADSIEELVEVSDHLVLALPATSKTARLINADVLARAKTSLHLINVARGRIVDQGALLQALDEGRIAGATLDVTDPEPPPEGDPIYSHPKVVLTPHVSWTGGEDAKRLADKTLVNLDAYAHGVALADVFDRNLEY
jgi:phosphoglycerate dehydrogenase-like enzyme